MRIGLSLLSMTAIALLCLATALEPSVSLAQAQSGDDAQLALQKQIENSLEHPAPTAAPTAPAANHDLAVQLIKLMKTQTLYESLFSNLSKTLWSLIVKDNPEMTKDDYKWISETFQKAFLSHIDQIDANAAALYEQNYSADELRQIVAFYQSPIGQKMLNSMPQMMKKSLDVNMPVIQAAQREALAAIAARLKQTGKKVPKEIGM